MWELYGVYKYTSPYCIYSLNIYIYIYIKLDAFFILTPYIGAHYILEAYILTKILLVCP
jgi:hypothetical protein